MTPEQIPVLFKFAEYGGFAILAALMFFIYRKDANDNTVRFQEQGAAFAVALQKQAEEYAKRQTESATEWREYGTKQGQLFERIVGALERIEERLHETDICPVMGTATNFESLTPGGRRRIDRAVQAFRDSLRAPEGPHP